MGKLFERHTSRSLKLVAIFMIILTATVALQFTTLVSANLQNDDHSSFNTLINLPSFGSVTWYKQDTTTKGNWVGKYGSYAHILPCPPEILLEIPIGDMFKTVCGGGYNYNLDPTILSQPPYNWTYSQIQGLPYNKSSPPYWDEYVSKFPYITYKMDGTYAVLYHGGIQYQVQYPVFEWAWDVTHATQTDPREVYYYGTCGCNSEDCCTVSCIDCNKGKTCCSQGWRLACWDDGGERSQPDHGYFNITMTFPQGTYLLSLYAYDYENISRSSQQYRIFDTSGHLLASHQISGTAFDNGVYETFKVVAPIGGLTIIVQVYNNAGHVIWNDPYPPNKTLNVLLSGIFVDKITSTNHGD